MRDLPAWHQELKRSLLRTHKLAREAIAQEQRRQERFYVCGVRDDFEVRVGLLVWVSKALKGPRITKFRYVWREPAVILEAAGFDNFRAQYLDTTQEEIVHCSAPVPYHVSGDTLQAQDLEASWWASKHGAMVDTGSSEEVLVTLSIWGLPQPTAALHETAAGNIFAEITRRKVRNRVGRYET